MECSIIFNEMVLVFHPRCGGDICRQPVGLDGTECLGVGERSALKLWVTEEENFVRACVLISRVTRNYYFKIS